MGENTVSRWKFGGSNAVFLSLVVWTVLLTEQQGLRGPA